MGKVGDYDKAGFNRETPALPKKDEKEMYGILE
jgi:3-methylcrotonyl-CoA carboxylase beta subunit